jgi:hypothetical protein
MRHAHPRAPRRAAACRTSRAPAKRTACAMAAARTGGCGCSGGGGGCATASSSSARSIGSPAPQWIPWQPHRDGNRVGGDTSVARDTLHQRARRSRFEPSLPKEAARIDRSPARPGGAAPSDGARCFSGVTAPAPSCAYTHSRTLVQGELGSERTNRPSVRAVQRQRHGALACLNGARSLRVASTCAPVERPHSGKAYRSSECGNGRLCYRTTGRTEL